MPPIFAAVANVTLSTPNANGKCFGVPRWLQTLGGCPRDIVFISSVVDLILHPPPGHRRGHHPTEEPTLVLPHQPPRKEPPFADVRFYSVVPYHLEGLDVQEGAVVRMLSALKMQWLVGELGGVPSELGEVFR